MDEKILRETFDHNLNESFRLKQLENGLSVFTVIKTTQTNLVTKSMEKPLFAHIRVTSRCNLKCAYCYGACHPPVRFLIEQKNSPKDNTSKIRLYRSAIRDAMIKKNACIIFFSIIY